MNHNLIKKYSVGLVLATYVLAYFLQSLSFFDIGIILNKTYAEDQLDYTNLVAIFVDDEIYNDIKSDIKRYAQTYIQGDDKNDRYNAISNSKAIVMPIDVATVTAPEIVKILENMYFDGISSEPSKLIGTVLVGDVPLPVVNQDGFIYPTIYPYVDFEEQKFIWNDKSKYFAYNDNPDGQAEIRHGIINFDKISDYDDYFDKLKNYSKEPSKFIDKSIWYDDFIANKQYFYKEAMNSYLNNFIFAEDIGYRRYTDLMVKLMQGAHNEMIADILEGFDGMDELNAATTEMNTPTMTLKKMIDNGYLKSYTSLMGPKQLDNMMTNVETANRWTEVYTGSDGKTKTRTALDNHYMKIELKDETLLRMNGGLDPLIITFNNVLEDIVNDKIQKEKYWMNEVIPLTYLKYDGTQMRSPFRPWKFNCMWKDYEAYENYFFGTMASNITSMKETSIYRGTFRNFDNIDNLTIDDIQNSNYPASDISDKVDLEKKSIGGSYDIFATQIEANRGYNINNTVKELDTYNTKKIAKRELWKAECTFEFWGVCWTKRIWRASTEDGEKCNPSDEEEQGGCELPSDFAIRNRGGASPLNLSGMNGWKSPYIFQNAILPIFDIAGSKEIYTGENEANSFKGVKKYSRLIKQKFVPDGSKYYTKNEDKRSPDPYQQGYDSSMGEDMKFTNWEATGDPANPGWSYSSPKSANNVDYFSKFDNSAHWENDILKIKKNNTEICVGNGEVFTYKTIDSRVVNDLTTKDQIGGVGFKPFQDEKSPVKIFYNGMQDKIARTNDALSSQINTLQPTTSGGIVDNILNLSQYIDDINSEVDDIINMPTSTITALSTTDIQSLASKWSNTIDTPQVEYISGSVNDIKDQFMDIDRFISNFDHTLISEYINTQLYNFEVNKWNLIFYTSWINNIDTNLDLIKTRFHSMEGLLDNVKIKYDNISDINLKTAQLTQKLATINAAVSSGSAPIGCISDYVNLCAAITKLSNDLILHKVEISDKIDEIENFVLDNQHFKPFVTTRSKINNSTFNNENANIKIKVGGFNTSNDYDLVEKQDGMNLTTSDRPIDSPKYITFKGIGGDLVNFIYPNIYKSEIFSGSNILKLKSPEQIADAIRTNLRESVKKYNEYLLIEKNNKNKFYSKNPTAYNKLAEYDTLASPISSRPYKLMDEDFLINELEKKLKNGSFFSGQMGGYEPIEFIAHMLYDQNIGWRQRKIGNTIQDDLHNIRNGFDVNDKISYTVADYLISDNNEGNFITPGYRDNGYEVVFINSDGSDYVDYKDEPTFVKKLKASSNNFKKPVMPVGEQSDLEESLSNNCNIPEDGGVMLFDLQTGDSPWLKALWCWREQIRTKPIEFSFDRSSVQGPPITFGDKGDNAGEIISKNLGTDNIQSQYMNQLDMLDTNDENQEVLDNSSPGDYQKLNKIAAYTQIKTNKQNINADTAKGLINISSSVELGDVEFHIENVGDSIINFDEEIFTVDPFNKKSINFNINNPKDGINVVMFHMCLPGTQDLKNCVKKSLRLNIIPGDIKNIEIKTPGNKILQGSKMPISIVGTDAFGNNVGQLVSQKFTISTSTGSIIYQSTRDNKIKFSNFNKSNFVLDAKNIDEGTQIRIDIDGYINGNRGTQASSIINVVKGDIKIKYKNGVINNGDQIKIKLPSQNEYTYKDNYNLNQTNLVTVPKIELNLVDNNGDKIDIKSIISISSKNGFIKAGNIETRKINKTQNGTTFEVNQNRFKGSSSYIISGGNLIVYLMPKFKAGDDTLFLSMPGIDDMQIPIVISPAPASMIDLATKKTEIAVDSNTKGHLKIMDNWGNTITQDTTIKLGATGPISISGLNNSSIVINITGGKYNFDINAKKQGGAGFVYAMINNLSLDEQKPGNATVTVQNRILPDKDLNIMYLNLFGSDWGNQRGYMSENNKYIQKLITNSKKLLTTTTQLISPAKIKKFAIITDNKLQINNIEEKSIKLNLEKIQGNKNIQIQIEDIGDINVASDSFKIKRLNISEENIETTIESTIKNYDKDNIIIYIPEVTDSIITQNDVKNNSIYINNINIFDIKNGSLDQKLDIKWTNKTLAGYQLRYATIDDKKIGRIIISANKNNTHIETIVANEKYDYNKVWLNGSTNQEGVGFYKIDSALSDNTLGYESIQDSINPTLGLGFRGDFKNITNFGAGENIGEATLPFSSEFLINIGDPLLKRIDDNKTAKIYDVDGNLETDTGFDKGLGEVVYSEPGKTIFKIKKIDFNNDGLEDIIVSFTDGTIKILKNYGGNTPFEQLGDLMILADGIKDIIIGDVDGNKYQDIIIWSKGDTLKVYKNDKGIFDVDGYPICINTNVKDGIISKTPQDISGIFQIFFEDMDQDGSLDIITNDKLGYIKIFYGGNDNIDDLDNYVSSDKYKCDDNRYQRENQGNNKSDPNTKIVYRFGIRVNENTKVLDKSRIHRDGINPNNDVTITPKELGIDNDSFSASNMDNIDSSDVDGLLSQAMNFDVNAAEQGFMVAKRYKDSNFGKIPTYEDIGTGTETDIKYVEIGCLTGTDPIKIYKKYEDINGDVLEGGDIVKVSITMLANDDFLGTWIDQINGPWKISLLENGMLEHFWFDSGSVSQSTIEDSLKFHWDMANNSRYMIDNIKLSAGDELKINYWLTYDGNVQTSKIEIGDINGLDYEKGANGITGDILTDYPKDNYPDIKIKPTDGCNKSMFVLFNENKDKDYIPEYIDLTEIMAAYGASNQKNYDNAMSDITNTLSDNVTSGDGPNMSSIPGLSDMLESWDTTDILGDTFDIDNIISQGGVDISSIGNVPSQILDSLLGDTMDKVDELMGGMCNGFDLSKMGIGSSAGGCGLPVPFNQGFLGPGDYHLFGCFDISPLTETLGKGRPVLNIPGNRGPTAAGYLPFPGLFGLPFRGPTDGFLGGVKAGTYPSQFRLYLVPTLTAELGIAMCFGPYTVGDAIPDPVSSVAGNCIVTSIPFPCKNDDNGGPNKTNDIPAAFLDLNACTNQNKPCYIGPGESSSSLELVSSSDNSTTMTSAIPDGSFAGGFINIEKTPVTEYGYKTPESGIDINGVELFGGADAKNKIRGGMAQGLIKKLAKNWMDKQINYIISNLTNFKVDVYWPDFGKIMGGMGHGGLSKAMEDEKIKDCYDQKGTRHKVDDNNKKAYCEVSEKQKCKNRGKDAKLENGEWICVKKPSPNQNDDAFGAIDSLAQNNLFDREQITNLENSSFANPFEKIEAMFDEVPLINIRTENITVKVPMISNEDISAYMNMSRNWIKVQEKTLKEWTDLLKAIIGFCGGNKNINNLKELKDAYSELKDKLKQEIKDNKDNLDSDDASSSITSIENKIKQIKNLNKIYNLNDLGDYEIYESDNIGKFWIKVDGITNVGQIIPQEVYLAYDPNESDPMKAMTMGTKGYDIEMSDKIGKIKISYTRNKDTYSNQHIHKKTIATSNQNQCANLFLGGKFDLALNNFINIQTSTDGLISSVRQNLEVLELYKKFPLDLYEWIHVGDRYMSEISSIINNFLGTLSLWMNTNATRYSQYVDSLIMIMTTIQTYQAIIDLSVNWSEKCSSCTNDNYDQFACKLSLLCPDNLPIFKIPPMKIPSVYIDLSHMNLATDIKLPKFNFVPTTVALPSLPNIPKPPKIDFSLSLKDSLDLGINVMGELDAKLDNINLGVTLPTIPVIPSPPDLPEIPSFLPSVKMELPLLPPAPKIPKLPNEISAAIDIADVIGQVMCIVKGNIGLVGEGSIKAKVEQMTQRTYEVPYWDDMDQTLSEWNTEGKSKIPDWITNMFGFLKSNEFQDIELQGFDFGIDSYVNLQYNFAGFYDFVDQIVGNVNKYSGMPSEFIQDQVNNLDNKSRELEKQMSACTSNPISEACMGDAYTGDIKKFKEWTDKTENQLQTMGNYIENGFGGVKEAMQKIAMAENKRDELLAINAKLGSGGNTGIAATQTIIHNRETIKELDKEILDLNNKYGDAIEAYELYLTKYGKLLESLNKIKNKLSGVADDALNAANDLIGKANGAIDGGADIIGDQLKELQDAIDKQTQDFDTKQIQRKDIRNSWLDGLKKNVEIPQSYADGISYVDFDKKTYQNNLEILQNSLNEIKSKTSNESFKKEIDSYLKLSKANKDIVPATDKINNIMNQYTDIINNYKSKNDTIIDNIGNDYDKFLFAVAQNDVQLVGNNDVDISLSSNLFDIDKDSLKMLDKQNSIDKIYLDYNNKNINGYLKAIESNSPLQLNMGDKEYNLTKKYLYDLKGKTELAYNILDNKKIITQNTTNNTSAGNQAGATTDISSYIDGKVIKTPNGSIDLANDKYVKDFQGKSILTDINNDGKDDLILRDKNNVYIKYKDQNRSYDNKEYNNRYYKYDISSYEDLVRDSDEGFVHINDIYIKLCDINREIKNFRYNGGDFDSIKVAWMNSKYMGDKPAGYLIKMIHRVDLFNDKEVNISKSNKKDFDKKYILALPKGSQITGTKIMLEEGTYRTESLLDGLIFDVMEYNENIETINLTIKDIPRNWQYSEIYTLESYKDSIYMINNSSSNQIVAGPQIIADTKGPIPEIVLYRPAIKSVIDTGEQFKGFVGTNYILKSNWEDNVSIEKLWIADEYGNIISDIDDINEKTGYIELGGLFFTLVDTMNYYFGATDINGNSEVTQVTLQINVPTIEIVDIQKYGNDTNKQINNIDNISAPATITAQIEHDIDEGYVVFDRYRNNIRQALTGSLGGIKIDKYNLKPNQTIITGGYYDFGDDIGLYTNDGQLAVKINPNNGKINILNGFENIIKIKLDYSNKTPIIKIMEKDDILFVLSFPIKELIEISSTLDIQELKGDIFGTFNGGKAIIDNDNAWIYIGPHGEIYAEGNVYGDYTFDDADQSIKYSFKKAPDSEILGYIKIKIKNLFGKEK